MPELGVNIDHVATIREARKTYEPDPVWAASLCELAGADGITVHLREDRRHIQTRDVEVLSETVHIKLNLEIACEAEVLSVACRLKPAQVTLVPEKREEVTTEGGLDVIGQAGKVEDAVRQLTEHGICVSLFMDPSPEQLETALKLPCQAIELHTGQYANACGDQQLQELQRLVQAGRQVRAAGRVLHAGHGLNYQNVIPIASITDMHELNIGHSIISRAVLVGMERAVREMKGLISLGQHGPSDR